MPWKSIHWEPSCVYGRTDKTKLTVTLRNFANVRKIDKNIILILFWLQRILRNLAVPSAGNFGVIHYYSISKYIKIISTVVNLTVDHHHSRNILTITLCLFAPSKNSALRHCTLHKTVSVNSLSHFRLTLQILNSGLPNQQLLTFCI